jgi:hypothetical protein
MKIGEKMCNYQPSAVLFIVAPPSCFGPEAVASTRAGRRQRRRPGGGVARSTAWMNGSWVWRVIGISGAAGIDGGGWLGIAARSVRPSPGAGVPRARRPAVSRAAGAGRRKGDSGAAAPPAGRYAQDRRQTGRNTTSRAGCPAPAPGAARRPSPVRSPAPPPCGCVQRAAGRLTGGRRPGPRSLDRRSRRPIRRSLRRRPIRSGGGFAQPW